MSDQVWSRCSVATPIAAVILVFVFPPITVPTVHPGEQTELLPVLGQSLTFSWDPIGGTDVYRYSVAESTSTGLVQSAVPWTDTTATEVTHTFSAVAIDHWYSFLLFAIDETGNRIAFTAFVDSEGVPQENYCFRVE